MTYRLDKGIPMPPRDSTRRRERRYPLREMEPGDSFLIPDSEVDKNQRISVRNAAAYYGIQVATRRVAGGLRVWAVSREDRS